MEFEEVNPRQVICVTSRAETDTLGKKETKDNIFTLAWHTPLSFEPRLYGICVGKERFSLELIRKSHCFVINFMPYDLKDKVLQCGRVSGKHSDKFKDNGFEKEEADTIDCPIIKEAIGHLECELINEIDIGDHVFLVGKVLRSHHIRGPRVFYIGDNEFSTTMKP